MSQRTGRMRLCEGMHRIAKLRSRAGENQRGMRILQSLLPWRVNRESTSNSCMILCPVSNFERNLPKIAGLIARPAIASTLSSCWHDCKRYILRKSHGAAEKQSIFIPRLRDSARAISRQSSRESASSGLHKQISILCTLIRNRRLLIALPGIGRNGYPERVATVCKIH